MHWRSVAKLVVLIVLIVTAHFVAREISTMLDFEIRPSNEDAVHRSIMISAVAYSILLAIPFVPGAEIGLAMIGLLGPPIAVLVYICTIAGLTLSFAVGRMIPLEMLVQFTEKVRLERTNQVLREMEQVEQGKRLEFLVVQAPGSFVPAMLRFRYLALAVALNLPGNFLIGGGGGIGLFAGVSRLFSVPGFLVTIALAVAPVPLAVLVFGSEFLGR